MKFILQTFVLLALLAFGSAWAVSLPVTEDGTAFVGRSADPESGKLVFYAGGCSSCHAAPGSEDKTVLSGGYRLDSDFGTFIAPNISQDPRAGIGGWSIAEFATALRQGVSPEGRHYFPAFPYATYRRMTDQDVADLFAYLQTLPADPTPSAPHEVGFPFSVRAGIGLWKALFVNDNWVATDTSTPELVRGRYLVEALAHCAECHTPRNPVGGLDLENWLGGAPNPSGKGRIPSIQPEKLGWSKDEIVAYLESGFTPEFDVAGGSMKSVVANFMLLPDSDKSAVAAYLTALR